MLLWRRIALSVGVAAWASLPAVADSKTLLRLNHQVIANTSASIVDQWYADEVKKRTNGEIEIKIFWSGGLGAVTENLSLIENGAIEMAAMSAGFFADQLPFIAAPNSIPMAIETPDQASKLIKRLMAEVPSFMNEAKAKGIRPLFFHILNPYLLVGKQPVASFDQLKGKKMRTWGTDLPRLAQAVGAVPVTLGPAEWYEGLMRGVVDLMPVSLDLMDNYKLYEVAKHVTEVAVWVGPTAGIWIGEKAWTKLTPAQQKVFLDLADEASVRDMEALRKSGSEVRQILAARGVTIHPFPDSEKAKIKAALPNYFDEFVQKMSQRGQGDDARKMVQIWREVVATN